MSDNQEEKTEAKQFEKFKGLKDLYLGFIKINTESAKNVKKSSFGLSKLNQNIFKSLKTNNDVKEDSTLPINVYNSREDLNSKLKSFSGFFKNSNQNVQQTMKESKNELSNMYKSFNLSILRNKCLNLVQKIIYFFQNSYNLCFLSLKKAYKVAGKYYNKKILFSGEFIRKTQDLDPVFEISDAISDNIEKKAPRKLVLLTNILRKFKPRFNKSRVTSQVIEDETEEVNTEIKADQEDVSIRTKLIRKVEESKQSGLVKGIESIKNFISNANQKIVESQNLKSNVPKLASNIAENKNDISDFSSPFFDKNSSMIENGNMPNSEETSSNSRLGKSEKKKVIKVNSDFSVIDSANKDFYSISNLNPDSSMASLIPFSSKDKSLDSKILNDLQLPEFKFLKSPKKSQKKREPLRRIYLSEQFSPKQKPLGPDLSDVMFTFQKPLHQRTTLDSVKSKGKKIAHDHSNFDQDRTITIQNDSIVSKSLKPESLFQNSPSSMNSDFKFDFETRKSTLMNSENSILSHHFQGLPSPKIISHSPKDQKSIDFSVKLNKRPNVLNVRFSPKVQSSSLKKLNVIVRRENQSFKLSELSSFLSMKSPRVAENKWKKTINHSRLVSFQGIEAKYSKEFTSFDNKISKNIEY